MLPSTPTTTSARGSAGTEMAHKVGQPHRRGNAALLMPPADAQAIVSMMKSACTLLVDESIEVHGIRFVG